MSYQDDAADPNTNGKKPWEASVSVARLRDPSVSIGARLLYANLCGYMNDDRVAWPGYGRLAGDLGASKATVKRYIEELESVGWISKKNRYNAEAKAYSSNQYTIHVPATSPEGGGTGDPTVVMSDPTVVMGEHRGVVTGDPITIPYNDSQLTTPDSSSRAHARSAPIDLTLQTEAPEAPDTPSAPDALDEPHPVVAAIRHEHTTRRTFGLFAPVHQRMVDERLGSVLDKVRPEWVPRAFDATEDSAEHPHLNYALSILRRWARQGGPDDRDAAERSRHDRQSQGPVRSDRDPYAAYTLNAADWDDPPGQSAV